MSALYLVGVWSREERRDAGLLADYHHYITADDPEDAEEIIATKEGRGLYVRCLGMVEHRRNPGPTPEFEPENSPHNVLPCDAEDRAVWAARIAEGAPNA